MGWITNLINKQSDVISNQTSCGVEFHNDKTAKLVTSRKRKKMQAVAAAVVGAVVAGSR